MVKNDRTLYFEGCGWVGSESSKTSRIGNCRVRTRFTNTQGENIYLELSRMHNGNYNVDHCFANSENDLKNGYRIYEYRAKIRNVKKDILDFVNYLLHGNFKKIVTFNNGEYSVHNSNGGYNIYGGEK